MSNDYMKKREREIVLTKIEAFNKAYKSGNFSKANAIKNELLNLWGIDADFESTFEPQK